LASTVVSDSTSNRYRVEAFNPVTVTKWTVDAGEPRRTSCAAVAGVVPSFGPQRMDPLAGASVNQDTVNAVSRTLVTRTDRVVGSPRNATVTGRVT
jgi:hypothetical protein